MDRLFRQSDFSAENKGLEKRVWNRLTRYNAEATIIPIDKNVIIKKIFEKAMQCKDADELIGLAKTDGFELTKEEAEAYMAEIEDVELDEEGLKQVAGGVCRGNCPGADNCGHHVCGMAGWTNFKGC